MKTIATLLFAGIAMLCFTSCATLNQQEYLNRPNASETMNTTEDLFTQNDTLTLRYTKTGTGKPMVMVHHVRGQLEYFDKISADLEKQYTLYKVDLPGHGASEIPKTDYTAQFYKKALYDFIKELGLENDTFLGESIGASLVLSLSSYEDINPEAIIAINPYDGKHGIERGNGFARFLVWSFKSPLGGMTSKIRNRGAFKKVLKGGFYDTEKLDDSLVETYLLTGKRKDHSRAFLNTIRKFKSFADLQQHHKHINCPTLLIHGETDWLPEDVRSSFFTEIKNANHITLSKTGHFASQESPEEILGIINKFMNSAE